MTWRPLAILVAATIAAQPAFADCALDADAQAGKTVAGQCKSCHFFGLADGSSPAGPNLHEVYGAKAGGQADFTGYSEGMEGARAKGVTWTDRNLMDYLEDPRSFLNKANGAELPYAMLYQLGDGSKRRAVIAYLKSIKGRPDCE